MRCEYIFTYQDFLDAMKAYRKVSKRAAIGYWLYVWILPTVGLAVGMSACSHTCGRTERYLEHCFGRRALD
jgi:hypothetical protein